MGLQTLLGLKRQGFFIPYRYADQLKEMGSLASYKPIERMFDAAREAHIQFIENINKYAQILESIGENSPPGPRWQQDWFPRLDGAAAYTMVREKRPTRIVEVGSGHSTRFMAEAVKDGGLATKITTIDPAPRATINQLDVTAIKNTVENAGTAPFEDLAAGDILFIDSSHILMPGSDVDFLINRILPDLPSGLILHIHDIYLPDDYPPAWAWRNYNEQQGVAALLQGKGFEILFSSHYTATRLADTLKASVIDRLELFNGAVETSLWLEKK
ncbi:MAG: class I SAM-dependent methyltransferase [Rhodospirillaceae bacterium]|nr:class I SAM-dependent methyltransferase [Rhodospirillaceae bacterium]MBT4588035.1 class I SAM-dependent methyltransferase [Rhodospirillaceae bacterium]MBT4940716.1 class I SAM-dependent methyltransferase [Rhodospirillaceae bacterium]MBT5941079.1 class I SAM-dependent methyltransferase [Rhodospirillaceae bacterium]MBT7268848.1 class I SAM-dependent methyltransferase [Rhodospirillaceae bacterium]